MPKSKDDLTLKQQVFVDLVREQRAKGPENITDAAMVAFDVASRKNAKSMAHRLNRKPHIRELIEAEGSEVLPPRSILETIRSAMDADRPDLVTRDGQVIPGGPDHRIRLKAADIALKVLDGYPTKQEKPKEQHLHIHQTVLKELSEMPYDDLVGLIHTEAAVGDIIDTSLLDESEASQEEEEQPDQS